MRGIQIKEYVKVCHTGTIHGITHLSPAFAELSHASQTPSDLQVSDLPDPVPAADEHLIQVHAAAANFFDILQIQGKYQNQPREPPPL